ncbi:coiled-coil domain-containing protein 169 isoform X1 [Xenopus laevis]|uniref:Coiled-coil domain-containing protein 169 isoform X1 n=2 Tax=Xenopus laevis TaxID=8355 RepID=A0A1L8HAG7_XENLA|nr:coiled-coil domain-containing protein 169 isoform X1 [Xenopus laevis]OCT93093.1 hypothetical protein XELAEV_18016160mg [Xenopus laevis]
MENVGDGSAAAPVDSYRLTEEIQLEKNKKEMLQMSTFELKNTIAELEQRLNSVEDEGNEWKTRYETQIELNKQLERQIYILREKSENIRGNPTDRLSSIRSLDQMPVGALNQFVKHLDDEKILLENQLKNFELRIEQEAKAYYKVNNERRMYISEIAQTSVTQEAAKKQQSDPAHATREKPAFKAKYNGPAKRRTMTKRRGEMTKGSHPSNMKH